MTDIKIHQHQTAAVFGHCEWSWPVCHAVLQLAARNASSSSSGAKKHNIICKRRGHPNVINLDKGQAFSGAKNLDTGQTNYFAPSTNPPPVWIPWRGFGWAPAVLKC